MAKSFENRLRDAAHAGFRVLPGGTAGGADRCPGNGLVNTLKATPSRRGETEIFGA
jgi:hypothetical protein